VGHWEQIGVENQLERERIAALPPWRRAARRWAERAIIAVSWLLLIGGAMWWLR
jgi:hypothetical protein